MSSRLLTNRLGAPGRLGWRPSPRPAAAVPLSATRTTTTRRASPLTVSLSAHPRRHPVPSRNPDSGHAAARSYSWISPPRRSCRTIRPVAYLPAHHGPLFSGSSPALAPITGYVSAPSGFHARNPRFLDGRPPAKLAWLFEHTGHAPTSSPERW